MSVKTIAICVAMDVEYQLFKASFGECEERDLGPIRVCVKEDGGRRLVLARNGIGKVNAAMSAALLIREFGPSCLISSGVAGGSDRDVEIGDIVVALSCAFHDMYLGGEMFEDSALLTGPFDSDPRLIRVMKDASAENPSVKYGLICTGDCFVDSVDKVKEIKGRFPAALAVDMESAALSQVCRRFNVPFCALRIISDSPLSGSNAEQYKDFFDKAPGVLFRLVTEFVKELGAINYSSY